MTSSPDDFWSDPFHACALEVAALAALQGWLRDSERVRREVYRRYEETLKDRAKPCQAEKETS